MNTRARSINRRQETVPESDCSVLHSGFPEIMPDLCCDGKLVKCDDYGRVTKIYFHASAFKEFSSLPDNIGDLTELTSIAMAGTRIRGPIPSSICNLSKLLSLELSDTKLQGNFPNCLSNNILLENIKIIQNSAIGGELFSLCKLENLRIFHVELRSSLTADLRCIWNLTGLTTVIILARNVANFVIVINESICSASNLLRLDVSTLNGIGYLPRCIGNLKKLERMQFDNTLLEGEIPPDLCKLANLRNILLHHNHFSDRLPTCIGSLSNLEYISIIENITVRIPLSDQ